MINNLKYVLAFTAVLAMAGTVFGEFTMSLEYQGEPVPGLSSWMLKVGGVRGFEGITIDGAVHQSFGWSSVPPPGKATPTPINAPPLWSLWGDYPADRVDTHLMIDADGKLGGLHVIQNPSNNFADNETCSLRNEYGADDGYGGAYFKFGMGTWTSRSYEGFLTADLIENELALLPEGTDFMQIVIPTGTYVWFNAVMKEGPGIGHEIHQMIPWPEPSALVILITGILCLLAIRLRK